MLDLTDLWSAGVGATARSWIDAALEELPSRPERLPVLFPQVPRRCGRDWLPGGLRRDDATGAVIDTAAWRVCDAVALSLWAAAGASPEALGDLYDHGDTEERTMALKCLQVAPIGALTGRLLGEAQRTNQTNHFTAAVLDSNLLARTVGAADPAAGFGPDEFARTVLKAAFLDLPVERIVDAPEHATEELSRMLQGLATEREAAGRKVWFGTNRIIAHAPTSGTLARLIGDLECGVDEHRLAAADAMRTLNRADLLPFVTERLEREDRPAIRESLELARDALGGTR